MKKSALVLLALLCLVSFSGLTFVHADTPYSFQSGWENSAGVTDGVWTGIITSSGDSPLVVQSPDYPVHGGSHACEFTTSAEEYVYNVFSPAQSVSISAYVYFANLPSSGNQMYCLYVAGDSGAWVKVVNTGAGVFWGYYANGPTFVSNVAASAGQWYLVQMQADIVGGHLIYSIQINGNPIAVNQANAYSGSFIDLVGVGGWGKSESITNYVDDVTVTATLFYTFPLPEYAFGGLLAISACIAAFATYKWNQNRQQKYSKTLTHNLL